MKVFHSAQLVTNPPKPIKWLIEGLLPVKTLGDVSGPPGDGKSTILLSISDCVSRGADWFGHKTMKVPVAWISGEASDEDSMQRDMQRLSVSQDSDIIVMLTEEPLFRWEPGGAGSGCWVTTDEGAAAINRCREAEVGFAVIDTTGSVTAGLKEIDNDQQRQLARHIKRVFSGITVLTVSHTNQSSMQGELDWRLHYLSRAGGNGFPGAIRWAAGVSKLQPDDSGKLGGRITHDEIEQAKLVAFGISKHNEMPRPADCNNNQPMIFEIRPDGSLALVADGNAIGLYQRQAAGASRHEKRRNRDAI